MTSLSGTKERSVTSRSRKYGMTDTSPTKSASFSPETWYRKAYEESRAGGRPAPEGAGSMPSSTGTPSPGSGTSSPGSFSGSPGTISPGIGTGSPGSLGGSPGFGTGSPGSASGSSPGSERGVWCENCNARLAELKRQALKLLIPGPYSSKDPSFSLLLHDKLQVPSSSRRAWNECDSRCEVCSTHLTQLKQEAVHMVFTLDHWDLSPSSPPSLPGRAAHHGPPGPPGPPRDWALLPSSGAASAYPAPPPQQAPQPSSQTPSPGHAALGPGSASLGQNPVLASQAPGPSPSHQGGLPRHGSKPSSLGLGRNGSPGHLAKATGPAQPLAPNSPGSHGNAAVLSTAALQAHQYRTSTGVTLYPYQISQMGESSREGLTEAALNHYNTGPAPSPLQATTTLPVATATPTTTSAAASFFARAAQKLNLTSKRRKPRPAPPPVPSDPPLFPTNFSGTLQLAPPPAPPCLLRAASKVKDTPGLGKVKVMVRVCPLSSPEAAESSSFLKVDPRKKQVTIMDPSANQTQGNTPQKRGGANQVPPKMFAFDAAFPHDASQAEVCAGTVAEVIQSVVNGADGCVFCFGHSRLGKSYTMIGRDDSMQTLGVIPCSISWLFKLINERKEKTAARFSVRVSAVEVWGKEESLKDLLSEVATGSLQDGQSPGVYLCEDPICGMQLQNQSELRAPTAEKAAFFLDAALAARSCSQADSHQDHHRTSHMLFTLHIYQYRMEKSSKGGMSGGRSRLHLIDLGSCVKVLGKTRDSPSHCPAPGPAPCPALCLTLSALGNVILALVNGSKHIPYKESKLTMLLRESLGNINCRTTMIAHISSSPGNFSETLSTIQIASRVLRMKKKKSRVSVQYTSSSSGGDSSCEEGRMRRPTQLRPFPSRGGGASGSELPLLRLHSDQDGYSSSEQSCDTVIYVGPGGGAVSDRELTDNEGPPDFVPIIPALLGGKAEPSPPLPQQQQTLLASAPPPTQSVSSQLAQPPPPAGPQPPQPPQGPLPPGALAPVPEEAAECLKCNTFAELQERLDCIDGSEEVPKFPFEEGPATQGGGKQEPPQDPPASASPWRPSNDQQLQDIREVMEEAELAQTMIHDLVQPSMLSGSKSVTGAGAGAGGTLVSPLQRTKSASLHDSRESLSAGSSSDGKPRPLGSPRLGIASLTRTSDYRPPSSPSLRCKVYTQKGVMPGTPPLSSQNLAADSLAADSPAADSPAADSPAADSPAADSLAADSPAADSLAADSGRSSSGSVLQSLSRTSPLGLSPQVLERARSLSGSLGSAETLCDDDVPQIPLDSRAEGPVLSAVAPGEALCVLEDELLCSMRAPGGRPSSIISFNSDCSVVAMASGSRPVSVISGVSEDLERHVARTTAAAVTGAVVAKAEVAMAKLRVEGEAMAKMPSGRSSISSWLSELSVGSEADHSLHSFSQSQGPGEALAEPDPTSGALAGSEGLGEAPGGPGGEVVEGEVVLSGKGTPTKDRLRRLPASQGRSSSSTSGVQNLGLSNSNFIPFKTSITTQPCVAVKPMLIQEPTILSSPTKTSLLKHPAKPAPTPALACTPAPGLAQGPVLVSMSSEIIFDDPWMRRDGEDVRPKELVCEVKPEKRQADSARSQIQAQAWAQGPEKAEQAWDRRSSSSGEAVCVSSPDSCRREGAGCEVALGGGAGETPVYSPDVHRTSSLPRGWHRLNRHDGLDASGEYRSLGVTTSTPCSPHATLDRRGSSGRQGLFSRQRGVPPLPPVRKSSLDQRNRAQGALSPLHGPSHGLSFLGSMPEDLGGSGGGVRMKGMESSRLFTAKLEQLASRTNSLGRSHGGAPGPHGPHYDCFSLERGESLRGGGGGGRGDSTMPRTGRSLTRAGSLSSSSSSSNGNGGGASLSPKSGPSKISAVSKLLMASPKARSLSTSSTKTLSFSTKSLPQAVNRSSSLPPNGKAQVAQAQGPISGQSQGQSQGQGPSSGSSWSTQSLSRGSRAGGLAAKLPLRAVNGRISELLQGGGGGGGGGSRSGGGHARTGGGVVEAGGEERGVAAVACGSSGNHGDEKPVVAAAAQALPSPYSKITAPRRPHRCSSGHASDNSSVLSGELPPAMGKTALFYHSGGSSGYESMLRDSSENTGSTSSAQDSVSEASSACSRRSLKNNKKRSNTGTQRRRLIPSLTLDSSPSSSVSSPVRKPAASPGARWVDGPLRPAEPFEIKVYEIDDVERLQRRRERGTKEVMYFSARLQILENRQQRISEVRARYDWLKKELEQTKVYLMLEPEKWTSEFDLQPVYELDSLEYLEALEVMTRRLQTRVNFCKAHLMMVTCFDMACRRR